MKILTTKIILTKTTTTTTVATTIATSAGVSVQLLEIETDLTQIQTLIQN